MTMRAAYMPAVAAVEAATWTTRHLLTAGFFASGPQCLRLAGSLPRICGIDNRYQSRPSAFRCVRTQPCRSPALVKGAVSLARRRIRDACLAQW